MHGTEAGRINANNQMCPGSSTTAVRHVIQTRTRVLRHVLRRSSVADIDMMTVVITSAAEFSLSLSTCQSPLLSTTLGDFKFR